MERSLDALPTGLVLVVGGVAAIAAGGYRASVAEVIDPIFVLALAPVFFAGGLLLVVGYKTTTLSGDTTRVLVWTVAGTVAVVLAADAVMFRARQLDLSIDPASVLLSVGAVAAAGSAIAAFIATREGNKREEFQARAERAEETLESTGGFAVARLDAEGFIDEWSDGATAITGFDPEDVIGARLDALYPDDEDAQQAVKQHLQRALKTEYVELDGQFIRADGSTYDGVGSLSAVKRDDTLLGYVLVLADRSVEREELESLQRRNNQLEAFASVVSHDLRNPLNVAIGNVSMARSLDDDEEKLETADNALERMENLIQEVLTLARQGEDVEEFERVDLEQSADLAWSHVDKMWAELETHNLPDITADGERVRRLLENLFRNAIEHGAEDVTIRVGTLDDGFYVEDDGPGIPEHKRAEIFDAGYTTGEDGTGLGLAIVKSIVDAHGWDIEAVEGSDGGARFEIRGVQTLAKVEG